MARQLYNETTPVVVTSLRDETVTPTRDYYIIKLANNEKFLATSIGCRFKKNWTKNLKNAARWISSELAMDFAKSKFHAVFDL